MYLYEDQFAESHDFPKSEQPAKFVIIASTARCGSHMLGHALHHTGSFGFPLEYANPANLAEWKRRLNINDFKEVIKEIQKKRTSPNGVFAIKIHYSHIKNFGGFNKLTELFPNAYYLLLSRKDVLKQAVSLSIASQTGVWIAGQKPVNNKEPLYSVEHIKSCLRETILDNASWRYSLAASGCNYLELDFDHVRRDLPQSIEKIANFIGVEISPATVPSFQLTKQQSDSINREWSERFISDFDKSSELSAEEKIINGGLIRKKLKRLLRFVKR